ncbi:hypothetical protein BCO18430_03775 [Burkholderia contaminans]|nr:hypothetical protein BCO18430_03775 [Burkholderia contaminans]VWD60739.1 hypothetical protein BCO19218_07230 [Burkholderia contaminans]
MKSEHVFYRGIDLQYLPAVTKYRRQYIQRPLTKHKKRR